MRSVSDRVIGISDMVVSNKSTDMLITYSLGSCIGLTLFDPEARVGGMLHSMMPLSKADPKQAKERPAMYTDTGVAALLQAVLDRGATKRGIVACVAGAANHMDGSNLFRIGERNYMIARRILWKNEILIAAEDIGGSASRTLMLEMMTGRTFVKSGSSVREF